MAKGEAREGRHFESTDLLAAKELAATAIQALKLTKTVKKSEGEHQKDLFDNNSPSNPWHLKKIE